MALSKCSFSANLALTREFVDISVYLVIVIIFFPWKTEENAPAINATPSLLMYVHMFVDDVGFSFTFLRSARLQRVFSKRQ